MTPHRLHQLLAVDAHICVIICPKFQANHYTTLHPEFKLQFPEAMVLFMHDHSPQKKALPIVQKKAFSLGAHSHSHEVFLHGIIWLQRVTALQLTENMITGETKRPGDMRDVCLLQ